MKPVTINCPLVRNRVLQAAESSILKPDWWFTGTFKYKSSKQDAVRRIIRFWDDVAQKENRFIVPIGSIGLTRTGHWHHHCVPLVSEHLSYRQLKRHWRCGFAHLKLYQVGKGAIPYTLNGEHHEYLPVSKPFTPKKWKKKNKKLPQWLIQSGWNVIEQALNVPNVVPSGEIGLSRSECSKDNVSNDLAGKLHR